MSDATGCPLPSCALYSARPKTHFTSSGKPRSRRLLSPSHSTALGMFMKYALFGIQRSSAAESRTQSL